VDADAIVAALVVMGKKKVLAQRLILVVNN
jgi:hypothetical protein